MQSLNADDEDPFVEEVFYRQVIEMLVKLKKQNQLPRKEQYESNKPEAAVSSIFWKTIREVADQEINKDPEMKNSALRRLLEDFEVRQNMQLHRQDQEANSKSVGILEDFQSDEEDSK